jgi:phenylalanyl-tRNA synthetase beta chain
MKLPFSLIKQYVDTSLTPSELADILTMAGLEVEKIENETPTFSDIIAAKVTDVKPHPNADKLCIATIYDGRDTWQVVCGASNCKKGMKTAFAKVGATITDSNNKTIKIKKAKLREVESYGMLCSSCELGLSDEADGIMDLPDNLSEGHNLSSLCDPIFDIALTPNLGHCMSAMGVAREIAALTTGNITLPDTAYKKHDSSNTITVKIDDKDKCQRYSCRIIDDVTICPSPQWLKTILISCGMRPINAVVDILNYVMISFGQPMHAFDYDKIDGKTITVKTCDNSQKLTCLDDQKRDIPPESIVISDANKVIALGGIIGGDNSSITDTTKTIVLEAAYFDAITIRKTSGKLSLRTESALRFEKGTDPNMVIPALDYACHLIEEICNGKASKDTIDSKEKKFDARTIKCRRNRTNSILGTHLSTTEIETVLQKLDFTTVIEKQETIAVTVPTYRNDITSEIDVIEEVARIYGYNNIAKPPPQFSTGNHSHCPLYHFESRLRNYLVSSNLQEVITSDLISSKLADIMLETTLPKKSIISVLHSKSSDLSILRPSLLPSLLEVIKSNHDNKCFDYSGFEVSKIHYKKDEKYIEQSVVSLVLSGKTSPYYFDSEKRDIDFFDVKGICENLFIQFGIDNVSFTASNHPTMHSGRQADIIFNEEIVGVVGEVHPSLLTKIDIKKKVYFAEINSDKIFEKQQLFKTYNDITPYPSSERDWTVIVKEELVLSQIFSAISVLSSPILEDVELRDIYRDTSSDTDKKNITLRFIYRDKTATLSFEKTEEEHKKIIDHVTKEIKNYIIS